MALYTCIFTLLELHPSGRVLEVGVAGSAVREQVIHYVHHFPSRRGFLPISVGGGGGISPQPRLQTAFSTVLNIHHLIKEKWGLGVC